MPKKKVLIADDDQLMHQVFADCLGDRYEYLHAFNGIDTLVMAVEAVPDLVILDIMMPLLDGRAVCRKIKSYPKTKGVKVVMVSAREEQSDRLVGFEVGADAYLEKTISLDLLARTVEEQLRQA